MRRITTVALGTCILASLAAASGAVAQGQGVSPVGNPLLGSLMAISDQYMASRGALPQEGEPEGGGGPPAEGEAGEEVQDNGTNPASLGFKFMPYYRYTELNNGVTSTEDLVLFAMVGLPMISPFTAVVLEWPVQKSFDAGALIEDFLTNPPIGTTDDEIPIPCGPPTCGGAVPLPVEGIARGFDISGVGDFRVRFLQGIKMIKGKKPGAATILLVGADIMAPTASDPILGDETWYGSPIFAHVHNLNPSTFLAFLHFYFQDFSEKSGASDLNKDKDIEFYMGRWFFQKAWPKSGYYMLPELQVIYDEVSDNDLSVMFLPEVGKSFQAGTLGMTAYIKPGWAVDGPDAAERRYSVELGIRMIPQ